MQDGLKALVALTCIAVLAALCWYGWREYDAYRERQRFEAWQRDRALASACQGMVAEMRTGILSRPWSDDFMGSCFDAGHLTRADFNTLISREYLNRYEASRSRR